MSLNHLLMQLNTAPAPLARLLDTTESLVYRNGIHATGIDAIVKASGVSR